MLALLVRRTNETKLNACNQFRMERRIPILVPQSHWVSSNFSGTKLVIA